MNTQFLKTKINHINGAVKAITLKVLKNTNELYLKTEDTYEGVKIRIKNQIKSDIAKNIL